MRKLLVLLFFTFSALATFAANTLASGTVAVASWLATDDREISLEQVLALDDSAWNAHTQAYNLGYTDRIVWFRIDLAVPHQDEWIIEFINPVLDHLEVFLPNAQQGWQRVRMGDKLPFAQRPLPTRQFAVPIELAGKTAATVYVRVESTSSVQLPTRLVTRQALLAGDRQALIFDTVLVGILAGLLLFNLLLSIKTREGIYRDYALWLLCMGFFIFSLDGMAFQNWWPNATQWNDKVIVLSLLCSTVFLTAFWLKSLADFVDNRWLPANWLVLLAVAGSVLFIHFTPYRTAIQITIILALSCALALSCLGVIAWRRGVPGANGLFLSFMPLLFGGYLLAMQRFGLVGHSFSTQYAVALGCALQAMLVSVLLAERIERLREIKMRADEVQRANRHLEASNSVLEAGNSALREALQTAESRARAIAEMKEELRLAAEERSRDKSKFLAQAVHDLKQPLQAISLALAPLQSSLSATDSSMQTDMLDLVQRATGVMRSQINSLLDLSRLESGIVKPEISIFPLAPFLNPLIESFAALATERKVSISHSHGQGAGDYVRSDPNLLRQVLGNLVGNAIKYADTSKQPNCWVSIAVIRVGETLKIAIEDNGVGIEERHLTERTIFQPFFQANNSQAEGEKGVGLGLSIVNAVLALLPDHGLDVSSSFGRGSCFTLSIPRAAVAPEMIAASPHADDNRTRRIRGAYAILVEDDVLVRQSIAVLLDHHGVLHEDFAAVQPLVEAVESIERRPDVVLTDYRLPEGKTAQDVIALAGSVWEGVPVIVLTGDAIAAEQFEARAELFGVLRKPVSPDELLDMIAAARMRRTQR
jgi:signal transduction histidine kinase/CheY-like chemotaxis protein